MKKFDDISFDEHDELINPRPEETEFDRIMDMALSRRDVMKGVMVLGSVAALGNTLLATPASAATNRFAFDAVDISTSDDITVPPGYTAKVVVRWGDPLWSDGEEFDHATRGTAASQAKSFGDNTDGMEVYPHGDKTILIANNEYTNRGIIWGNRPEGKAENDDDILKGMNAHGLTVAEIEQNDGVWSIVKDSPFNRRITPDVEMDITGPAAGHDLMKTSRDPAGMVAQLSLIHI